MCDTTFSSTFPATYTGIDIANANRYAYMKLYKKKMDDYNQKYKKENPSEADPLEWVNRYPGGKQTSYPCDMTNKNLSCLEGDVRITSRKECEAQSVFSYDPKKPDDHTPNAKDGWYLQWLPPSSTSKTENGIKRTWNTDEDSKGDCYMGNYLYRTQCYTSFTNPSEPAPDTVINKLHFNKTTGQCMLSHDYCQGAGFNKYIGADGVVNGSDGGTCELSGPQKFEDFLGGSTFARGICGGACHFMNDTAVGQFLNQGNK